MNTEGVVKVLLVEPDPALVARIAGGLAIDAIPVETVPSAFAARAVVAVHAWDIVLIGARLSDGSGLALCAELRDLPCRRVVLAETASEADRVAAFEAGADDVVPKTSLSVRELSLRVRAIGRRPPSIAPAPGAGNLVAGPLVVDAEGREVRVDGRVVRVSAVELALLTVLLSRPNRVIDRSTLALRVWNGEEVQDRTVDSAVKRLRARLGAVGDRIETVRGFGYRLRA
ncbi:MAG: response regulator transcription factor [Myxococcota bacterium]